MCQFQIDSDTLFSNELDLTTYPRMFKVLLTPDTTSHQVCNSNCITKKHHTTHHIKFILPRSLSDVLCFHFEKLPVLEKSGTKLSSQAAKPCRVSRADKRDKVESADQKTKGFDQKSLYYSETLYAGRFYRRKKIFPSVFFAHVRFRSAPHFTP